MEKETVMQSYLEQHLMSIPELEVGQIVTGTVALSSVLRLKSSGR